MPEDINDFEKRVPELAEYRTTATRLRPRRGTPGVRESSVGGPLLWPAEEEWPVCEDAHEELRQTGGRLCSPDDVHTARALLAARGRGAPTDEERAALAAVTEGHPAGILAHGGPVPLIPVAQLFQRDIPDYFGPPGTDLVQVLWCPLDHDYWTPEVSVFWRTAAEVGEVLAEPPQPAALHDEYLPNPCVVTPEQVTEYEYWELLPEPLRAKTSSDEYEAVSVARGWKAGGFTAWNLTGPAELPCDDCGSPMRLLLAADPWEPDAEEDKPTGIMIGRGYTLWIRVCRTDPTHPVHAAMQ
ncbi:hypothetical protein AB0I28_06760 [Phytomonospora sp. NPDC050363]|uniref:hypothetical protein n=1 Tax=Phytomonospora sp. NPDC050363 TaxID=3155642 RepID=UPI0033D4EA90